MKPADRRRWLDIASDELDALRLMTLQDEPQPVPDWRLISVLTRLLAVVEAHEEALK